MATTSGTSEELTESDIPGAILEEPLEKATVHALKWWLLCRGIKAPSSWRKAKLIERLGSYLASLLCFTTNMCVCACVCACVCVCVCACACRVREAKKDGMKVVDVDGSYLHRKQVLSGVTDTPEIPTSVPLTGWVPIDSPASVDVDKIPRVTQGKP